MKRKLVALILFLSFLSIKAFSESDTLLVKDLSIEWVFYEEENKEFFPLVDKSVFKGNTIYFILDLEDYVDTNLYISSLEQPISLFVNNQLIDIVSNGEVILPIKGIMDDFRSSKAKFTLYSPQLNPYKVETKLVDVVEEKVDPLGQENIIVIPRDVFAFNNFFIISCITLGIFLAFLYNFHPRVLSEFYKLSKALNPREVEENLIKSRPLSQINLLFYFFISLLIGLFLLGIINFGDFKYSVSFFRPQSLVDGLWKWFQTSLVLFIWIVLKLVVIHYFTKLYRINGFLNAHFFNYMRLTFILFSVGILALVSSKYILLINQSDHYAFILGFLFIFMGVNIFIIYLKLISAVSSKKLHLFSYLCGTELIPFGIILSLGINQTF